MPKVIITSYSDHYDIKTGVQFTPVLVRDPERGKLCGSYIGVADLDEEAAKVYENREAFEILTPDEFAKLITPAAPKPPAPVAPSQTGDPLADVAADKAQATDPLKAAAEAAAKAASEKATSTGK